MSQGGALGRENVGMSNRNAGEMPAHRKPKVSLAMIIIQGLVGPKVKPRGDTDGQQVNIPAPFLSSMRGRRVVDGVYYWIYIDRLRASRRQIRAASTRDSSRDPVLRDQFR